MLYTMDECQIIAIRNLAEEVVQNAVLGPGQRKGDQNTSSSSVLFPIRFLVSCFEHAVSWGKWHGAGPLPLAGMPRDLDR